MSDRGYVCINFEFTDEGADHPDSVITAASCPHGVVPRVGEVVRLTSERFKNGDYQTDVHICQRRPVRRAEGLVVSVEHDIEERGGDARDNETVHYVTVMLKRVKKRKQSSTGGS